MKKELILRKQLNLNIHLAKATLAKRKSCRFPRPLLYLLQEKGTLTSKTIASDLLCNPYSTRVAQLWIDSIFEQGLISRDDDGDMVITEEGQKYLKDGLAFISEENEWLIIYCEEDSRVDNRLIDIKKLSIPFKKRKDFDNIIQRASRNNFICRIYDDDICSMLELNNIVKTKSGKEFRIVELNIEEMPLLNMKNEELSLLGLNENFLLQWNVSKREVSFKYNDKEYIDSSLPEWASETEEEIIAQAVSRKLKLMDVDVDYDDSGKLRLPFMESLPDETKRNLVINCPINKTDAGTWDDVNIPVEVTPASENDAAEWFVWMFVDGINGYITDNKFNSLLNTISKKIDWSADGMSKREFLQDVLEKCKIDRDKKMFIQASLDWNL